MFVTLASTTAREDGLLGKRAYKSSSPTGTCTPQNLTGESASISALLSAPFSCRDCSSRATVVAVGKWAPTKRLSGATRFFPFMPNTSAIHSSLEIFSYRLLLEYCMLYIGIHYVSAICRSCISSTFFSLPRLGL